MAAYGLGARGSAVRRIQERLSKLGIYSDRIDGIFGESTKDAVGLFQLVKDLKQDGIVGPKTSSKLFNEGSTMTNIPSMPIPMQVFIGHGRNPSWLELKFFLSERLKLPTDEFNRIAVAGHTTVERLTQMLDVASFAFLIMTAEDEQATGDLRARENVVHEVGLFQGRLGFRRAIVLLEIGCTSFSNIAGLTVIPFPSGHIATTFEQIRHVLEREGLVPSV